MMLLKKTNTITNKPRQIRLIALDVDGTLFDSDHHMRDSILAAVATGMANGVQITLASGRNQTQIHRVGSDLNLTIPLISLGGACISSPGSEQPIRLVTIPRDLVEILVKQARESQLGIMLQLPSNNLLEADQATVDEMQYISGGFITSVDDILENLSEDPGKITLTGDPTAISTFQRSLDGKPLAAAISGEDFLDITPRDADKGAAVQYLIRLLGLDPAEVAAVGDGHNDISMFQKVGFPIAMGNAAEEVQQYARLVAPTNDQDGVAWAINWIVQHNATES